MSLELCPFDSIGSKPPNEASATSLRDRCETCHSCSYMKRGGEKVFCPPRFSSIIKPGGKKKHIPRELCSRLTSSRMGLTQRQVRFSASWSWVPARFTEWLSDLEHHCLSLSMSQLTGSIVQRAEPPSMKPWGISKFQLCSGYKLVWVIPGTLSCLFLFLLHG